jgi:hypothetical protein
MVSFTRSLWSRARGSIYSAINRSNLASGLFKNSSLRYALSAFDLIDAIVFTSFSLLERTISKKNSGKSKAPPLGRALQEIKVIDV